MTRLGNALRMFTLICLSLAFLTLPIGRICATVADDAQVQADKGEALALQGGYAQAVVEWQKILDATYPSDASTGRTLGMVKAEALVSIAEAQRQLGHLDDSLAAASSVLADYSQFRSECCEAALIAGKICQAKGDKNQAIHYYSLLLQNYPEKLNRSLQARSRIEELLPGASLPSQDLAYTNAAIAAYDVAKHDEDTITAARRAAKARADSGNTAGARADLLNLLGNPSVLSSHGRLKLLAEMQLRLGDKTTARATYNKMLLIAANECLPEEYRRMRLETYYNLGDYQTVITEGNVAMGVYANGALACHFAYYVARSYDSLGNVPECLDAYNAIIGHYSAATDPDIRTVVSIALGRSATRLIELNRKPEALPLLQRIVSDYGETAMARSAAATLRGLQQGGSN